MQDHADGITSGNCFEGLTAAYIIYDPAEDALNLPTGKYDVPLQISDKMYTSSGALVSVDDEQYNFFGDIIEVNYQPWPYLEVEPRKYRFRLYNNAMSRPFDLHVEQANGDWLDFQVIASDSGLFGSPVESNDVVLAMGERYEIVVDFSEYAGQNITMKNTFSMDGMPSYANTDLVMYVPFQLRNLFALTHPGHSSSETMWRTGAPTKSRALSTLISPGQKPRPRWIILSVSNLVATTTGQSMEWISAM